MTFENFKKMKKALFLTQLFFCEKYFQNSNSNFTQNVVSRVECLHIEVSRR